jgi:hypothetical protein
LGPNTAAENPPQLRRVERRQVRAVGVIRVLKCSPRP